MKTTSAPIMSSQELDMNDNKTLNDCSSCGHTQKGSLKGSNERMAEERPECEPLTDINLVDSSYNIWDIDIETLILEDEGGESLTDSDEEDYRNNTVLSERTQSCLGHSSQDPFSHSIKAWGNLKEPTREGQRPKSVNLRASSTTGQNLREIDRARSAGFRDGTSVPAGSGVTIKVQVDAADCFNCVGLQKGEGKLERAEGGFLHPDMMYSVIAEKVIDRYRTRANSDSSATTVRMTEKVCSFRKNFMEKMAQRRRSLPVVPRRLEPLQAQVSESDSSEELTSLRCSKSLQAFSGLKKNKMMALSRSSGSLNMDHDLKDPFTKDKFMVLPSVRTDNVSQASIQVPQQELPI